MWEKISKKDLIFGFIIFYLINVIVLLVIWKIGTPKEILDQVSFASSISSILLALIAIVYAFIQSKDASEQHHTVQKMLHGIMDQVQKLENIKEELSLIKDDFGLFKSDSKSDKTEILQAIKTLKGIYNPKAVFQQLEEQQIEVPKEVQDKISKDFSETFDQQLHELVTDSERLDHSEVERIIANLIKNEMEIGQLFRMADIYWKLKNRGYKVTPWQMYHILHSLCESGLITRYGYRYKKLSNLNL